MAISKDGEGKDVKTKIKFKSLKVGEFLKPPATDLEGKLRQDIEDSKGKFPPSMGPDFRHSTDNPRKEHTLGPGKDRSTIPSYTPEMPKVHARDLAIFSYKEYDPSITGMQEILEQVGHIDTHRRTLNIAGSQYKYGDPDEFIPQGPAPEVDFEHLDVALRALQIDIHKELLGKVLRVFSLLQRQPNVTLKDLVKLK